MRIVVTSDTNYHPQWHKTLEASIDEITELKPDCVILAGDVRNDTTTIARRLVD